MSSFTVLGIRHHGPGSARAVQAALTALEPDMVLIEAPADAQAALTQLSDDGFKPPIALLQYNVDDVQQASFFPFAHFSPEWLAIQYCLAQGVHMAAFDLPMAQQFALPKENPESIPESTEAIKAENPRLDPLGYIAQLDGYSDGESWWEAHFEGYSSDPIHAFSVIHELMQALREAFPLLHDTENSLREAFMRQTLRQYIQQGYQKIAIVCGAWHGPALTPDVLVKDDQKLLKGLKQVKTTATWVPWTYSRLSSRSGYAAGIDSPQWYQMLYEAPNSTQAISQWTVSAARQLRAAGFDASIAHSIEVVRLSESLATLKGMQIPSVYELLASAQAIFCGGHVEQLRSIEDKLVIGQRVGKVPSNNLKVPLLLDVEAIQKKLRLVPQDQPQTIDLDLRKTLHLDRSVFLHRLLILGVNWGRKELLHNKKGTFNERWHLLWNPDYVLQLIDASTLGNTLVQAATVSAIQRSQEMTNLPELANFIDDVFLAELPDALPAVSQQLADRAALTHDAQPLLEAFPPLVEMLIYGNVRNFQVADLRIVIDMLVPRLFLALPAATQNIDSNQENSLWMWLSLVKDAFVELGDATWLTLWLDTLGNLTLENGTSPELAGRFIRIRFEHSRITLSELELIFCQMLSPGMPLDIAARWIYGFIDSADDLLFYQPKLFALLIEWVANLSEEAFREVLPLFRRMFAYFDLHNRAKLFQLVEHQFNPTTVQEASAVLDGPRTQLVLAAFDAMLVQCLLNAQSPPSNESHES
jgi:hypothetical protein